MAQTPKQTHKKRHFFVRGPIQIGKSTFLRGKLAGLDLATAGFVTQKVFEGKQMRGFEAVAFDGPIPGREGPYHGAESLFIDRGTYQETAFTSKIKEAGRLAKNDTCQLIYLDEIGGPELQSDEITAEILSILRLQKPVIGVLKSWAHLQQKISHEDLKAKIEANYCRIAEEIRSTGYLVNVEAVDADLSGPWQDFLRNNSL